MKIQSYILFTALAIITAYGCNNSQPPAATGAPRQAAPVPMPGNISGTVAETMNSGGYTYVLIDTGTEKLWAAGPQCTVSEGDAVSISAGMLKQNFTSKTLNRTFEKIYFVGSISGAGGDNKPYHQQTQEPMGGKARSGAVAPAGIDFTGITKPAGGKTVSEIFSEKKPLSGKQVQVRGKVIKFNARIMDKNWVHIQDGTGGEGTNDITITTQDVAKVGDTVLVTGTLVLNKDFGFGYKYDVMIEGARVQVEQGL